MGAQHTPGPTDLAKVQAAAKAGEAAFVAVCKACGFKDEWDAYRTEARGEALPAEVKAAHVAWMDKLHGFYLLRDGPGGVLGGTGC